MSKRLSSSYYFLLAGILLQGLSPVFSKILLEELSQATLDGKTHDGVGTLDRLRRKSADNLRIKHIGPGSAWFMGLQKRKDVKSLDLDAYILDEVVHGVALWNAGTTATGIVGDVTDPNGTYTAIDLKATDLLAGESISVALAGGKAGADIAGSQFNRRYSTSERTITLEVTLVGTAATTGESHLEVIYTHYPPQEYGSTGLFVAT